LAKSSRTLNSLRQYHHVDSKDGVFSLFMHSAGLPGGQAKVFALHTADAGGVHVLLFISSIKLDLANHTVIFDNAVLPLSHNMMTGGMVQKFLGRAAVKLEGLYDLCDRERGQVVEADSG
jgi:hypothetical protein